MAEDTRMMIDLAREALAVQDACNLSGVVHGFSRSISRLRALLPMAGTDAINRHPVCQLWADKIAQLSGTQTLGTSVMFAAYREVDRLSKPASDVVERPAMRSEALRVEISPNFSEVD